MTADVSIQARGDHLRVTVAGDVDSVEEVARYSADYRAEAIRLRLRRVLIDYTDTRFLLDYHDLFELAEIGVRRGFQLTGLRVAAVCSPENVALNRQYETIAANRSISYHVFTDEAEAMARLLRP